MWQCSACKYVCMCMSAGMLAKMMVICYLSLERLAIGPHFFVAEKRPPSPAKYLLAFYLSNALCTWQRMDLTITRPERDDVHKDIVMPYNLSLGQGSNKRENIYKT